VGGLGRVRLDLGAEPPDVSIHETCVAKVVIPPDPVEELLAAEHYAAMFGEFAEQPELGSGERDRFAVALNDAGTAVIRDYRWSEIATKLEDLTVRPTDPVQARDDNPSPHLRFNIRNDSERPIAFVADAQDCAFSVEAADGQAVDSLHTGCADAQLHAADVVVLRPGESLAREFKLEEPRWHIRSEGFSGEIGKLQAWQQFRLAYRPPAPERFAADVTPEQRALLWGSAVLSPAFNNRGRVD